MFRSRRTSAFRSRRSCLPVVGSARQPVRRPPRGPTFARRPSAAASSRVLGQTRRCFAIVLVLACLVVPSRAVAQPGRCAHDHEGSGRDALRARHDLRVQVDREGRPGQERALALLLALANEPCAPGSASGYQTTWRMNWVDGNDRRALDKTCAGAPGVRTGRVVLRFQSDESLDASFDRTSRRAFDEGA